MRKKHSDYCRKKVRTNQGNVGQHSDYVDDILAIIVKLELCTYKTSGEKDTLSVIALPIWET